MKSSEIDAKRGKKELKMKKLKLATQLFSANADTPAANADTPAANAEYKTPEVRERGHVCANAEFKVSDGRERGDSSANAEYTRVTRQRTRTSLRERGEHLCQASGADWEVHVFNQKFSHKSWN